MSATVIRQIPVKQREPKPYVTYHAQERFREHHPGATWDDVRNYIRFGTRVDGRVLCEMLGRRYARREDVYVLSPDRKGVFVLTPKGDPRNKQMTVVTYLRQVHHQGPCQEHWPTAA